MTKPISFQADKDGSGGISQKEMEWLLKSVLPKAFVSAADYASKLSLWPAWHMMPPPASNTLPSHVPARLGSQSAGATPAARLVVMQPSRPASVQTQDEDKFREFVEHEFLGADVDQDGLLNKDEFYTYYYSKLCFDLPPDIKLPDVSPPLPRPAHTLAPRHPAVVSPLASSDSGLLMPRSHHRHKPPASGRPSTERIA